MLAGGCLCGAVKYRIAGDVLTAVNCHCSMCRKAHGAAFRSGAVVKVQDFSWLQGEELPFSVAQHWNVASKASWFEITDHLPQHAVVPERR
ncbi:MAG: GFA family protein [Steroidobacteraceae bacterium]